MVRSTREQCVLQRRGEDIELHGGRQAVRHRSLRRRKAGRHLAVSHADFKAFSKPQQMAFLIINAYNAFTVELILTK